MDWRLLEPKPQVGVRLAVVSEGTDNAMLIGLLQSSLAAVGVAGEVVPLELPASEFEEAMGHLRTVGFRGAAIANPHKVLAARVGEKFFMARESVGVANAILFENGIFARNTEVGGFIGTISSIEPGKALVLGAGQAGRSVVMGLFEAGWKIRCWNRNAMKTRVLQTTFKRYGDIEMTPDPNPTGCKLVVNATPLGMKAGEQPPLSWSHIGPKTVVYDLIIRRVPTELLRSASARGLKTIGGRELLVEQVAISLEWWLGSTAPRDAMRAAVGLRAP